MNPKYKLNQLLNKPVALYEKFHAKTKIKKLFDPDDYNRKSWPKVWSNVYFKGYNRFDEILLPKPDLPALTIKNVLSARKSRRKFRKNKLRLSKISSLLGYAAGLCDIQKEDIANRFYPSAGARYPLEVYLVSDNTQLPKGLYHYYLKNHSLENLYPFKKIDYDKYFNQGWIKSASCLVLITSVFKRTVIKYADRGYRHIMIEVGHLGQNFYLVSACLGLSCCAVGGFADDELNNLIDIDGINEAVVYVLAVG